MAVGKAAWAQMWSANPVINATALGRTEHPLFNARERRKFIDEAVAAGDARPASSAGAYGRGDHKRAIEYEKSKALKGATLEKTNQTLAESLKEQQRTNATLESYNRP